MERFGDNWAPNATSTQVGGSSHGASYSTRIDSGLTPIQKQVLIKQISCNMHSVHSYRFLVLLVKHGLIMDYMLLRLLHHLKHMVILNLA